MAKLSPHTVVPMHPEKFYVYALFKPQDVNPFYIGKGKGDRINNHFKPCNLKVNSRKVGIIKKYGNNVRREILCYFDLEESAYEFEEELISLYGLVSEGGLLANYAKNRFQYSDMFVENVSSKGHLNRKTKYSKDTILKVYDLHFREAKTSSYISDITGVPVDYIGYIVRGKKWKSLYKEYLDSGDFKNNRPPPEPVSRVPKIKSLKQRITSDEIKREFDRVCSGEISLKEAADILGFTTESLSRVFLGQRRGYLNLDNARYRDLGRGTKLHSAKKNYSNFLDALENNGGSLTATYKELGMPKTTAHRLYRKYLSEVTPSSKGMASDTGGLNGTGDSAPEDDTSVSNQENT